MDASLVDVVDRTVSSRAFTDPAVFAREQRTVFTHSWLCVGHRSQVPKPGDFVQTRAGTRPLILCHAADGSLQVIANVCSHRGARICQVESGHASRFTCPYHSWTFSNRGDLIGVPRQAESTFDKSRWPLQRAHRVDTHGDLVFATFSDQAPSLREYLGDFAFYLDLMVNSCRDGTTVSAAQHRARLHCNWKIPAEQFGSDNWHFQSVHGSVARMGMRNENPASTDSFHAWFPQGHMLISVAPRTELPSAYGFHLDALLASGQINEVQRRLLRCTLVMTVFPNLSFVYFPGMCSMRLWHPVSAGESELWSWALSHRSAAPALESTNRSQVTRLFSPTGMLEQDDFEVWARLGDNLASLPQDFKLCYAFDAEEAPAPRPYPGQTATLQSDVAAFAFYRHWADVLSRAPAADPPPAEACR